MYLIAEIEDGRLGYGEVTFSRKGPASPVEPSAIVPEFRLCPGPRVPGFLCLREHPTADPIAFGSGLRQPVCQCRDVGSNTKDLGEPLSESLGTVSVPGAAVMIPWQDRISLPCLDMCSSERGNDPLVGQELVTLSTTSLGQAPSESVGMCVSLTAVMIPW